MMMLPMSIVMIHNRLISIHDDVSLHTLTHWLNHDARFTEHRYKPYYGICPPGAMIWLQRFFGIMIVGF